MTPLLLAGEGDEVRAAALAAALGWELGRTTQRRFPDGERFVRIDTDVAGRAVWLCATLHPVEDKLLATYLLAATARDLGARTVALCAPYLAYLRQDARFQPGEGVTSRYVARLLELVVDRIVTVDPHLHRYRSLTEVYGIPCRVLSAAPAIAAWIAAEVPRPCLVGPDAESAQWVHAVAEPLGCPHLVLTKTRRGDREVSISEVPRDLLGDRTPVIIDDIVSTARTMIETVGQLRRIGAAPAVCVGVHGLFADRAYAELAAAGADRIVTCDSVTHPSNAIDLTGVLAAGIRAAITQAS